MIDPAWLVMALNRKSLAFFVALLPQFIDCGGPFRHHMPVFQATLLALAVAKAFGYRLIASRARDAVRNPRAMSRLNKAGGGMLVGAGVVTAASAARGQAASTACGAVTGSPSASPTAA
jgi:threonine/homoserine/homoserine lactone efflux protein